MPTLSFEEEGHIYKADGVRVPSVTQAIKEAGLIDLTFVKQDILEYKADLGNKVHLTTELYDNNNLDEESLHPTLRGYLNAWIKFRKESGFTPIVTELKGFHPLYRYAGKIDRIGLLENKITQLDIKSGVHHHSYAIQSAGYTELYNYGKHKNEQIKRRFTIYLKEDGTYSLIEYKEKDYSNQLKVFLASLTISNYLRSNK